MSFVSTSNLISVGWLVEQKIIKVQIGGAAGPSMQTANETGDYDHLVLALLDQSAAPIHVLVHVQPGPNAPYPSLSRILSFKYPRHPHMGYIVVVNQFNSPMVRFLMSVLGGVSGVKLKGVNHLEDGLKFLQTLETQA